MAGGSQEGTSCFRRPIRLLVCGGRDFADFPGHEAREEDPERWAKFERERDFIAKALYAFCDEHDLWQEPDQYGNTMPFGLVVVAGAARGADTAAADWAVVNWLPVEEHLADWKAHGRAAGPIRNQEMLDSGVDYVMAFPGGRGTEDMVKRAKKAGVPVLHATPE